MKRLASLLLALTLVFAMLLALPLGVSAAEACVQDGLKVTITTDRDAYVSGEDIQITVKIENTNNHPVERVSAEALLPDGLTLKSGSLTTDELTIDAGASYTLTLVAQLHEEETTAPEETTEPEEIDLEDLNIGFAQGAVSFLMLAAVNASGTVVQGFCFIQPLVRQF